MTDKLRKYVLPNIPYVFIGWAFLKLGTAYRLAAIGGGPGQLADMGHQRILAAGNGLHASGSFPASSRAFIFNR